MSDAQAFAVAIGNTGESYRCAGTQNLLAGMEALARKGIPVGCRGGGCGVCKVRVVSGEVRTARMSRAVLSPDERAQGLVLACRAFPRSDLQVAAVDKLARCVVHSFNRSFPDAAAQAAANP